MRKLSFVILIVFTMQASAKEGKKLECIKSAHNEYISSYQEYWDLIGVELKTRSPKLYREFHYLIVEQKNSARLNQITLDHLINKHVYELRMDGVVYNVAPVYSIYQNRIFRELMELDEFSKLFRENRGYENVEIMPNYQRFQEVTLLISTIKDVSVIKAKGEETLIIGQKPIVGLQCPAPGKSPQPTVTTATEFNR